MGNMNRVDMNGISFPFPCVYLDSDELQKIISGINSAYHTKYAGKKFAMHRSVDLEGNYCIYYFENHGFSDYNIVEKIYD